MLASRVPLFQLDDAFRERQRTGRAGVAILDQRLDEQILGLRQIERLGAVLLLDAGTHVDRSTLSLLVRAAVERVPHVFDRTRSLRPCERADADQERAEPRVEAAQHAYFFFRFGLGAAGFFFAFGFLVTLMVRVPLPSSVQSMPKSAPLLVSPPSGMARFPFGGGW
jgi:hypothetical protein